MDEHPIKTLANVTEPAWRTREAAQQMREDAQHARERARRMAEIAACTWERAVAARGKIAAQHIRAQHAAAQLAATAPPERRDRPPESAGQRLRRSQQE